MLEEIFNFLVKAFQEIMQFAIAFLALLIVFCDDSKIEEEKEEEEKKEMLRDE